MRFSSTDTGMRQPQDEPAGGGGYEHPTPQIIFIKGKSPFINISLPMMQQYYTNVNQKNQDYAFFQVVYSDIPVVRSLNGILPGITTIDLQLTATVNYYDTEETRDYDIYAQIHLKFDEVQNMEQIAEQVRQQILIMQHIAVTSQVAFPSAINKSYVAMTSHVEDFQFDPLTQKFMFVVNPKTYDEAKFIQMPGQTVLSEVRDMSFTFTSISNSMTNKQRQFLANVFGGTYDEANSTWSSKFSIKSSAHQTSVTGAYYPLTALRTKAANSTDVNYRSMSQSITTVSAYSSNISKFYSDNYVYIRGAPEASIWNTDGTSTDYAAILPRNRGYGMHLGAADAYIADRTSVVKTSLNSLRVMRLQITDSDGNPIEFLDDYVIKFQISFNI